MLNATCAVQGALVLALAGCAPARLGTGCDAQQATCMPRSRALQDAARNLRFDTARWPGRPAVHHHHGQPDAGVLRNVAIDTDPRTTRALFRAGWSTASPP